MIDTFRSKALRQFWEKGNVRGLRPDLVERILDRLTLLHAAGAPTDVNVPGSGFHGLQGSPQRYALAVNKNWRITFGWSANGAIDVDLEDYH
jgi:toxin HigB-1